MADFETLILERDIACSPDRLFHVMTNRDTRQKWSAPDNDSRQCRYRFAATKYRRVKRAALCASLCKSPASLGRIFSKITAMVGLRRSIISPHSLPVQINPDRMVCHLSVLINCEVGMCSLRPLVRTQRKLTSSTLRLLLSAAANDGFGTTLPRWQTICGLIATHRGCPLSGRAFTDRCTCQATFF